MEETGLIGLLLILANVIVSYQGLKKDSFQDKYLFRVEDILLKKQYYRLITSGFLHVSWWHLIFNMLTLYCFSYSLEGTLGPVKFLIIYFGSLIGGDLFALFIHRQHADYSAVGASGALSGVVFASIALFPGMEVGFPGLNIYVPSWFYGLFYVLTCIYGIRSQRGNIGHEAHLGGGLIGLLIAIAMVPKSVTENYLPIALILVPSAIFIYLAVTRPSFLILESFFKKEEKHYDIDDKYNSEKRAEEMELDDLLDKISNKGLESLSRKEKEKLKRLSER